MTKTIMLSLALVTFSIGVALPPGNNAFAADPDAHPRPCSSLASCPMTLTVVSTTTITANYGPMPSQGTTDATVVAQFPSVILWAFETNPGLNTQITNMPDIWLARMSHEYYVDTNGAISPLLKVAAQRLTAANLLRFAASFGATATGAAVNAYAPSSVKASYLASTPHPYIHQSQSHYAALGLNAYYMNGVAPPTSQPNPAYTSSLNDIFLEFYCVGNGVSYTQAVANMVQWAAGPLGKAFGWGFTAGTIAYHFGEWLDPGVFEDLIEFYGSPFADDDLPTGTVTVGEIIDGNVIQLNYDDICGYDFPC